MIVALQEPQIVDVDLFVEVFESQPVHHALAIGVLEIEKTSVAAAFVVDVGGHCLPVDLELAVRRQPVPIHTGDMSVAVAVEYRRGKNAECGIGTAGVVLVEETRDAIVAALFVQPKRRVARRAVELDVVLEGAQEPVSEAPELPGSLRGAVKLSELLLLSLRQNSPRGKWRPPRTPPDPARIDQGVGRARIADPAAPGIRARGGYEDFLPLNEKETALGEEHLERRQINDHVIRLDDPEIGIDRCRDLEIRRGAPEQVGAHTIALLALYRIITDGDEGIEVVLLARRNLLHLDCLQCRHELRFRRRQCGPTPTLVDVRDLP